MRRTALVDPAAWPAEDQALWQALTTPAAGPLDDAGALATQRPTALGMLADAYGRWISWLLDTAPAVLKEPPARRATPERLLTWVEAMAHLAPMTRKLRVAGVLRVLRAAAPEADWSAQTRIKAQLHRVASRDHGHRKQGRILPSDVLLQAGLDLAGAGAEAAPTLEEAMACQRDGLMVAFLALLPLRLTSVRTLELGRSVLRVEGQWIIAVEGDRMKAGKPWEAPLPSVLAEPFDRYVHEVRPWLLARGPDQAPAPDWLWLTDRGEAFTNVGLARRIGNRTEALTGVRVPPHFFRDAAATTAVRHSPDAARLIRPLLAHQTYRTAERHYIHAQGIEAGRDYAALIERLTKEAAE